MKLSGFFYRFVCLLAACLLLVSFAAADTVQLSSMSDEEIVELLTRLNQEIVSRGIDKTAKLPQGTYIGGKDLPVGRYIFTCTAKGDDWGNVTVHTEGGKGSLVLWEVVSAPKDGAEADTIFITLNDGDELKSQVPFTLTVMSGAIFQ